MAGKKGKGSGKAPAASGGGDDYVAAYSHALAGRLPDAEALCREILATTRKPTLRCLLSTPILGGYGNPFFSVHLCRR